LGSISHSRGFAPFAVTDRGQVRKPALRTLEVYSIRADSRHSRLQRQRAGTETGPTHSWGLFHSRGFALFAVTDRGQVRKPALRTLGVYSIRADSRHSRLQRQRAGMGTGPTHLASVPPIRADSRHSRLQRQRAGAETGPTHSWGLFHSRGFALFAVTDRGQVRKPALRTLGVYSIRADSRHSRLQRQRAGMGTGPTHLASVPPIRADSRHSRLQRQRAGMETGPTHLASVPPIRADSRHSRLQRQRAGMETGTTHLASVPPIRADSRHSRLQTEGRYGNRHYAPWGLFHSRGFALFAVPTPPDCFAALATAQVVRHYPAPAHSPKSPLCV